MRRFGLVGYPLRHSFSPAYFADKFEREGIKGCAYQTYPLESIRQLIPFINDTEGLEGLNVTIPYKQKVIELLHHADFIVEKIQACNCIKMINGQLFGYNTDVIGFEKSLLPLLKSNHSNALILGTGGGAKAVQFVLEKLNIAYSFVSRRQSANPDFLNYSDLSGDIIGQNQIIVNTTPVGMLPDVDKCPDINFDFVNQSHLLYDLIYNPAETLFLKKGAERGAITKNGMEMLIIQAEESWKIWNDD